MRSQHSFQIVRRINKVVHGTILPDCDDIVLYDSIPGRMSQLRFFSENFTRPMDYGEGSAKMRRVILNGTELPNKILNSDFVVVHWGTPPNVVTPLNVPDNTGPQIVMGTISGDKIFTWNPTSSKWENGANFVSVSEGVWTISNGSSSRTYNSLDTCVELEEDFQFYRFTAPPVYYKIIRYKHQLDVDGRWHHTTLQVELDDRDYPNEGY